MHKIKATLAAAIACAALMFPAAAQNVVNSQRVAANVKCDVVSVQSAYTVVGTTVTVSSLNFSGADVGKIVLLPGQGSGGSMLRSTITSVGSHSFQMTNPGIGTMQQFILGAVPSSAGTGYAPAQTITLTGGTATVNGVLTIQTTKVVSATIANAGSGGTNGTQTVYGTTGTGHRFVASVTVAGGIVTAVLSITDGGHYKTNPTSPTVEPVSGAGLSGAQLNVVMGVDQVSPLTPGVYASGGLPTSLGQGSTSGTGAGAVFDITGGFNDGGFVYGSDDSTAINAALAASNLGTVPQSVLLPGRTCGVASTIAMNGNSWGLVGATPMGVFNINKGQSGGTTLQWLGTSGGTMMIVGPTSSGSATLTQSNRVEGLTFQCAVAQHSGDGLPSPQAANGLQILSHFNGTFDHLNFSFCSNRDVYLGSVAASAGGVMNAQMNRLSNIELFNFLPYDGVGIETGGNSIGDADYNYFKQIESSYLNSPSLLVTVLDNNIFDQLHFFARPNAQAYGIDIAGDTYGAPPIGQANTAHFYAISSTSIARGLESTASPPTGVLIDGYDFTNGVPVTVCRPGNGAVAWKDYQGFISGCGTLANGMFLGQPAASAPGIVATEQQGNFNAAKADAAAHGAFASAYLYNGSTGALDYYSDGTNRFRLRFNGSAFALERLTGTLPYDLPSVTETTAGLTPSSTLAENLGAVSNVYSSVLARAWANNNGSHNWTCSNNIAATGDGNLTCSHDGSAYLTIDTDGHISYGGTVGNISCDNGSPTVDAHATDTSGTFTGGVASTSCILTFGHAYSSFNHCRVTAETPLAALAYSYNLSTLTVTATAIGATKVDYACDGN